MVNNLDWLGELSLIDFLRDTGKHFTVPYMLAKDSVQVRMDRGLSFTEFSYMLLQAYDFWHLHRTRGVELQMGGADQWGNITAGLELIRRTGDVDEAAAEQPAHGLAYKLLLSPSGTKFGKSETGESVWLDPARTTPFAFYQYWLQHRRPRRRHVPALVHRARARTDRGARRGGRGATGDAQRAASARPRHHGTDPRRSGGRQAEADGEAPLLGGTDRRSGDAADAVRLDRWLRVHPGHPGGAAWRRSWPTRGSSPRAVRPAA